MALPLGGAALLRWLTAGALGVALAVPLVAHAPAASADGGVTVDSARAPGLLNGGTRNTVDVVVGNDTASTVEIAATVQVPDGWQAGVVDASVLPGASSSVAVPVTPPLAPAQASLTAEVHAQAGVAVTGTPSTNVLTAPPGARVPLALDAGTASSMVFDGYRRLSPEDVWDPATGYGWVGEPPSARDRGELDALRTDFTLSTSPATLRIAVPPGVHDVYLLRGDAGYSSGDTIVSTDSRVLANPGDVLATGDFQWERFWLDGGTDGRGVDLTVSGLAGNYWRLAALVMMPGSSAPVPTPPADPPAKPVTRGLFGMDVNLHGSIAATTPTVRTSWYRLWDADVNWMYVEPARGQFDWTALDTWVDAARAHHANVLYTFGLTPRWAVPSDAPWNYAGSSSPPVDLADWDNFVTAVATRYRGRIAGYELWNEINLATYYSGSPATMVEMARRAYTDIKSVDPNATVVCPSVTAVTTATSSGVRALDQYFSLGLTRYCDAIGVHLYTHVSSSHISALPETWVSVTDVLHSLLAMHHINKPIWNTETGWGRALHDAAGNPLPVYTGELADGLVARSYILAADLGLAHYDWYAWTNRWAGLFLDADQPDASGTRPPTEAGISYETVQDWLIGAQPTGCSDTGLPGAAGAWTCGLHYPNLSIPGVLTPGEARGVAVWCTTGTARITLPAGTVAVRTLPGRDRGARPGEVISVGNAPVLVITR